MAAISAADVAHLLRRAGFGGSASRIAQLAGQEQAAVVDQVLDIAANPADVRPAILDQTGPNEKRWERLTALRNYWYDRMAFSPTPVVEKMTLFWHGHFTTSADSVYRPNALWEQMVFYRANALGNFRTLAHGMALQPAMLLYLNNDQNRKKSPNQNFARELLELFLLGIGNYTEQDVFGAAAAWTGHTVDDDYDADTAVYVFNGAQHDTGNKTFFGKTQNWDGPQIIDEIFDNPSSRVVMAKYIVGKLWSFFATPNPPANVVNELAAAFIAGNWELKPLMRALFLRPEFSTDAVKQGLVRTPIEYLVAVMRATGWTAADINPEWWLDNMGQEAYNPPNVSGWRPNGYWVSAAAASAKANFADWLSWKLTDEKVGFLADSTTHTPADAVTNALAALQITEPSAHLRQVLENYVTTQRAAPFQGWAEPKYLTLLTLLSPDLQLA